MSDPRSYLPLTGPVFQILLAIAGGERHGYGILLEIERRSDGAVKMGTGTLYTAIKRMLASGLIEQSKSRPHPSEDDERRTYYQLTTLGAQVVRAEAARMDSLVGLAREKRVY